MSESVQNIIASVYGEMNVSPIELALSDIETALTDTVKGMFSDLKTSLRDVSLTDESDCNLTMQADGTYQIQKLDAGYGEYFDPIILRVKDTSVPLSQQEYVDCYTVPLSAFSQYENQAAIVCSFSGVLTANKRRVWINKKQEFIAKNVWRVRFAASAASILFTGENPPIPSDYIPYLKIKTILRCVRLCRSKSTDWKEWKAEQLPILMGEMTDWERKWTKFCDSSDEPEEQDYLPYNAFRSRGY